MNKSAAVYIRDNLRMHILRQAKTGARMSSTIKSRFQVTIKRQIEDAVQAGTLDALDRLRTVGLRGFSADASPAEELVGMRVLFTYLTKRIEGEDDDQQV